MTATIRSLFLTFLFTFILFYQLTNFYSLALKVDSLQLFLTHSLSLSLVFEYRTFSLALSPNIEYQYLFLSSLSQSRFVPFFIILKKYI